MRMSSSIWGIETEAQQLASLVTQNLPVTVASVALWDEPSLALTVKAVDTVRPIDRSLPVGARVSLTDLFWHRMAFEQGEPVLLESSDDRDLDIERQAGGLLPNIRSMYLSPIRIAEETVGLLVLGEARATERERFSAEKRQRCQTMLDEFLAATAHAWEARRLRRQVRAMSSLIQLVRGISKARSFEDVLGSLCAEVGDWLGIPVRGMLLGTMGREVRLVARWRVSDETLSDDGRQMFLAMTRSGGPGTGPMTMAIAGDDPLDPLVTAMPEARSWTRVGLPLMRDEQLIGVACLYLEDKVRLTDWELEALHKRAEITALGMVRVRTALDHQEEQRYLHRVAFELLTGYRQALLQEVFGGLRRTLPGLFPNRLRGAVPALAPNLQSEPSGEHTDALDAVVVEGVCAAVSQLLERSDHPDFAITALDLNEVVGRAFHIAKSSLDDLARRRGVTVEIDFQPAADPLPVQGSLVLIGAILHAIESAVDVMTEGGRIEIRTSRENGYAVVTMEDFGRGAAPRGGGPDRFRPAHSSLELALVQAIAHRHGGHVTVELDQKTRNTILLRLPESSNKV
jgi:signal transduction histidine kinase